MIKAKIDDKNCKILLKGIEDNGKNLCLIGALYERR